MLVLGGSGGWCLYSLSYGGPLAHATYQFIRSRPATSSNVSGARLYWGALCNKSARHAHSPGTRSSTPICPLWSSPSAWQFRLFPAIPTLAKSFNVSFGVASFVLTAFLLGGTIGTIPTGWLIDRFGRRRIMLAGPLLTAVLALGVAFSQNFPELLVLRFFDGWSAQMWLIGRMVGISARAEAGQRGKQVSWMFGFDGVGRLAGPLAGGFIAAAFGLRAPFAAYAVMALLALIPVALFITDIDDKESAGGEAGSAPARMSARQVIIPRLGFFAVAFAGAVARGPILPGCSCFMRPSRTTLAPRRSACSRPPEAGSRCQSDSSPGF